MSYTKSIFYLCWGMLTCTSVSFGQSTKISTVLGEFELQRLGGYDSGEDYYVRLVEDGAIYMVERLGPLELVGWTIMITDDQADVGAISGTGLPDWIPAVTLPQRKTIVMLVPGAGLPPVELGRFETTLLHELTHAYLYAAVPSRVFETLPDWYIEGLAGYISGEAYDELFYPLVKGGFDGVIRPLWQLKRIHLLSPSESEVAYAQSYFAMLLLEELYGTDTHMRILDELARGSNFAEAFYNSVGVLPPIFDRQYLHILKQRFNPWMWLTGPRFVFVLFPLLVLVAFVIRRNKMRRQMAALAHEDRLVETGLRTGELPPKVEQILARSAGKKKN